MKLLITIFTLFFGQEAFAILEFEDATSPEIVTSARALAMGNAYMSKVDDSWASFYNPAGLGSVRKVHFHLLNVHSEWNQGLTEITSGNGNFLSNTGNLSKALTASGTRELLADNPGTLTHARLNLFPNITFRGMTLGYVYSKQNRARMESATSDVEFAERTDSGPLFSLSFALFGGILKFGASAIYLTREEFQKDFAATDELIIDKETDFKKGSMTYVTAGTRLTLPIAMLPSLSLVVRNSSNGEFYSPQLSGVPDKIMQTVDAGLSLTPYLGRTSRFHFEVNVRDIGKRYEDVPASRKVQAGFEIDWYRVFFFRVGYGDGWGSGGIGLRSKDFIFELTTYATEISPDKVRETEDRRTVFSIARGF